jgi:uncharacterized protein (TIGR02145 family)
MRTKLSKIAQAAALGLAMTFTLSCSGGDDGGGVSGPSIPYGGETYQAVVIGTQTWMARNLNYNAPDSKCYDDDPANCNIYGRLYDWSTAMDLPSSCNTENCTSLIGTPHKGICPSGWHIPSDVEWGALMQSVNPNCSLTDKCANASKLLKATSRWTGGYEETDAFGFSALPGGYGGSDGRFSSVRIQGYWWSASEHNSDSDRAYIRAMVNYDEDVYYNYFRKNNLYSVRCLKD